MNNPLISIVVAIGENTRVMGKEGKLPWEIPEDLKRFKEITSGHPIIMGRKTYKSIGKALPNRTNIIITRNPNFSAPGCVVVDSLQKAIDEAKKVENEEIFIIGGGEIFNEAISLVDKLYLTLVKGEIQGDVFFPEYAEFTHILSRSEHNSNGYSYTFLDLVKN